MCTDLPFVYIAKADLAKITLVLTLLTGLFTCLFLNVQLLADCTEEWELKNTLWSTLLQKTKVGQQRMTVPKSVAQDSKHTVLSWSQSNERNNSYTWTRAHYQFSTRSWKFSSILECQLFDALAKIETSELGWCASDMGFQQAVWLQSCEPTVYGLQKYTYTWIWKVDVV